MTQDNNIPQGYKQTELGIIPEDWNIKSIGEFLSIGNGHDYKGKSFGNIPVYGTGGIITHIDDYLYDGQTICIGRKGTIDKPIFHSGKIWTVDTLYYTYNFIDIEVKFIYYLLLTIDWMSLNEATGVPSLTSDRIKQITLALPPIAEQRAIAEALSDVDGLIAALDKKIAKKRLLKQGAMQQLLTGKKRLPGFTDEWGTIRLGDWATMNSGGTPTSSVPEYYNGHIPFLSISDITEAGKYINKTEKTITEKGLNNSSARMFPAGTIMYAMYASLGKCSIANIELSCSQAILGITPKCRINPEYLYYYLSFIEEDVRDMGQTGTQSNLSKQIVQGFMVKLPSDIKEQQAIATILSDMDKEITDLEAQRDKYRLLKSGMMQKLLTGQIRLVKQQAKIVPLGVEAPVVREIPVATHIIAGHIVNRSHKSRGWGRTKLQKSLHLIGYCMQLNLGTEYIRNTAGPDDQQLMNYIDQKFRQYRHVNKVSEKLPDGKTHYSYTPTPMIQDVEMAYEKYPKELREQVDALIDKLNTMDLAGAEILSTLYAVWNNRIIKQDQITDDLLIADFYAWSTHKADFEEARVRKALNYMRDNNIIPVGWGKYIDKR